MTYKAFLLIFEGLSFGEEIINCGHKPWDINQSNFAACKTIKKPISKMTNFHVVEACKKLPYLIGQLRKKFSFHYLIFMRWDRYEKRDKRDRGEKSIILYINNPFLSKTN